MTKYLIETSLMDFAENILKYDNVIEQISSNIDSNSISFSDYPSIIIFLNEYRKFSKNESINRDIHKYISKLIGNLKVNKKCSSSLCYGIIGIGYSVFHSSDLAEYEKLFSRLNELVIKITKETLFCIKRNMLSQGLKESDYDLIQGLASNLVYLINIIEHVECLELIEEILRLFTSILDLNIEGKPNMLITKENMINEELREVYSEGYVNLGLSHGIASIVMATAIAFKNGIIVPNQKEAINNSLKLYMELAYIEKVEMNGVLFHKVWWPGRIGLSDFRKKNIIKEKNRASWCYGTPGIARVMYLASKIVKNNDCEKFAFQCLEGLTIMDLEEFMLDSVTICHGFSGVLMIADSMYKETKNMRFKQLSTQLCEWILSKKEKKYDFFYYNYDYSFTGGIYPSKRNLDLSLLEGSTGVMLSLLNYTLDEDMSWKKILFI